ncbi:hypothetical protein TWF694_011082 [Orbilia ellipsospora]|uniref:Uncharacterized protein n=1 Tax=Orbilia ellipsospora TaxID=2528407 RepID=A0AAV9X943_9PEZI
MAQYEELTKKIKQMPPKRELRKLSPSEQEGVKRSVTEARFALQQLCLTTRDKLVPNNVRRSFKNALGHDTQFNIFLVASKAYQIQAGRFLMEAEAKGSMNAEQTQIPQLRDFCINIPREQKLCRTKYFIHNISRAFSAAKFLVEDLGASLTRERREAISKDLHKAVDGMKKGLFTLRETCSNEIGKEIESLIKETDQLSLNSVKYCKKVQSKARQELNWQTYRVICARGGDYSNSKRHTDKNLNLNSKFLGAIDDKLANTWSKSMDKIRRSLNNYTVKFSIQLNVFKERWMSILYEHCGIGSKDIGSNKNDITNALQGMSLGTEKLYLDQTQRVDQQQRDLNRDFRSTNRMRDALMNAYQEASDETGL